MASILTLQEFLAALARRSWRWGETDCMMILADWVACVRGVDPAAPWRGAYADAASCAAIVVGERGLRRLACRAFAEVGLAETLAPVAGDIALVRAPVTLRGRAVPRHTGAICVGLGGVALMTPDRGMVITRDLPIVRAWSI